MTDPFGAIGREELLFSVKAFIAAVLALWIALYLDFPRPYWAMGTAYIVAHPLAGAATTKALYRVLGTFAGAVATIVLVPNLVDAPELLCLGLALWMGLCLFISLLDRTPRSYVFMLAGYTAAIIGFQSVNAPEEVFDTALARVEEITIGILCSALVFRVVFPRHVGLLLSARIETWMGDAGRWAGDVLSGQPDTEATRRNRRRLATDTFELLALTTHLPYDTSPLRYAAGQMRALDQRMTALLPILTGIGDRLAALRCSGDLDPELHPVFRDVPRWIASGQEATDLDDQRLHREIARIARVLDGRADPAWTWRDLLTLSLLARLRELVEVWADCLTLRQDIATGSDHIPPHLRAAGRYVGNAALHLDTGMALLSGVAATIGTLICSAFWIATGWQDGAGAAMMGAVFCSLFAFMDNPVPVIKKFNWYMVAVMIVSGLYQFAILPAIDGFPQLILVMAPFLLFFGALMPTPRWGPMSMMLCVNLPLTVMIQSRLNLDFAAFVNSNVATIVGIVAAIAVTSAIRSIGVQQSTRRLLRANWADLAKLADQSRTTDTAVFIRRLVDRFGLLVQRIVTLPGESRLDPERVLSELRIGLNIADLQRLRTDLPPSQSHAVAMLLQGLSDRFKSSAPDDSDERSADLLPLIDEAITRLADRRNSHFATTACLRALVGIRTGLLPSAPDFVPIVPMAEWEEAS